jgi:HSP20 family protein
LQFIEPALNVERGHVDSDQKHKGPRPAVDITAGVDGVFRGLGHLLRIATELAESAQADDSSAGEPTRTGRAGTPGRVHAVYGVSVRMGPRGRPVVAPFGNVRENGRKEPVVHGAREPLADVLDEGDHYLVIVELPGVDAAAVQWAMRGERVLVIHAGSGVRAYSKRIELGEPVAAASVVSCYANGVLELKLWKQRS